MSICMVLFVVQISFFDDIQGSPWRHAAAEYMIFISLEHAV